MPGLTPQQALEKLTWKGAAAQASSAQASRSCQAGALDKEATTIIDGAGEKKDIEAPIPRSRRRSRRPLRTMIAKSFRSVWPSLPAASR